MVLHWDLPAAPPVTRTVLARVLAVQVILVVVAAPRMVVMVAKVETMRQVRVAVPTETTQTRSLSEAQVVVLDGWAALMALVVMVAPA